MIPLLLLRLTGGVAAVVTITAIVVGDEALIRARVDAEGLQTSAVTAETLTGPSVTDETLTGGPA